MRKKYNKYTSISDRFPFIAVAFIIGFAVLFIFIFQSRFPLAFFSGGIQPVEKNDSTDYSIYISSPANEQVFRFVNENESVAIEVKSKEIEKLDYRLKLEINKNAVKVFNSPPYEYNWKPTGEGQYELIANLVDENDRIVASSNTVKFEVEYSFETIETITRSIDIEEKKKQALADSVYRTQNGAPIFAFKVYQTPAIDGNLDDWEVYDKAPISNPTILKENFTNMQDCSGVIYGAWDDSAFYFAVQVVDDVFVQNYTGAQINNGDSVTLVFDTDLEVDFNIPFYNSDDFHIDFSPGNFAGLKPEAFIYFPSRNPMGIEIASKRTSNGYIIEAKIPWENFVNFFAEDMDVIGFTASIFDTDHLESTELVVSSSSQFEINNVTTLGTFVFIDGGDLLAFEDEEPENEDEG